MNNQGSLFALTKNEYEAIRRLIDEKNDASEPEESPAYLKGDALGELFIEEQELDKIVRLLKRKKNLIVQGPPGVGKTFVAKRLAYLLFGSKDESRIEMIQFHQSYSYEDFIQGFRPLEGGGFAIKDGLFVRFCLKAQQDPNHTPRLHYR